MDRVLTYGPQIGCVTPGLIVQAPAKEMMIGPGTGGRALLAAATAGMTVDPIRLIADSGFVAQAVLLALLGFSVLSWAVMVERARAFRRAETDSNLLQKEMQSGRRLSELNDRAG